MIVFCFSFLLSGLLLYILKKNLPVDFMIANFNLRSNHLRPARQIGGLACIPASILTIFFTGITDTIPIKLGFSLVLSGTLVWIAGYFDDKKGLTIRAKLAVQTLAAIIIVYGLGENFRFFPELLPQWIEALFIVVAIISSINVTNFMDGLDWLTVTGIGIPLLFLGIIAIYLIQDSVIATISFSLSGSLAGFAIFNRSPASIFLGDSGSLPLGLLSAAVFLLFANNVGILTALILPLYYILDSTSTIILRLSKRENILQAHSCHAYQVAKRSGKSVNSVTGSIAALNIILGLLTITVIVLDTNLVQAGGLIIATMLTILLLLRFRNKI